MFGIGATELVYLLLAAAIMALFIYAIVLVVNNSKASSNTYSNSPQNFKPENHVNNTQKPEQKFCVKCGAPNDMENMFCGSCGAKQPELV